jgi:superfamily II DNA/RNA helicase
MLFSATMPGPIIKLARTFLTRPTHIRAEENDVGAIHERTKQFVYRAHSLDKAEVIARVLQARERGLTMIFTKTKRTAQKISDDLVERGFASAAVHGDLGQGAREQALRAFRAGKVDVLVATDVAARGIDVEGVTHVINYQCPEDEKTYVHRIGRTGRAGREGVAVTLVDWDEEPRWKSISDALGLGIPEPAETYSTSDHLFTDLDVPTEVTGRLPLSQRTRAGLAAEVEEDLSGGKKSRSRSSGNGRRGRTGASASTSRPAGQAQAGGDGEETESKPRRKRARTRTRGGVTAQGGEAAPADEPQAGGDDAAKSDRPRRVRRRRRAGADMAAGDQANTGDTERSAD